MTPIFLLSLPRSGSTLLQRKLMEHCDIATSDEPWLLLPLLLAFHPDMIAGIHDQTVLVRALEDFRSKLPEGQADWDAAVRGFAEGLYRRAAADGESYFLDKTPRYTLVAEDLVRTFPEAKFIVLWRDPLSIVHSMNETWGSGRWAIHRQEADLFAGLDGLLAASHILGQRAKVLRYEDLVSNPETEIEGVFRWLGLDTAQDEFEAHRTSLTGRMGDPKRFSDDGRVRSRSPHWRTLALNAPRRRWMRKYLNWLGRERLATMGYDQEVMLQDLKEAPSTLEGTISDFLSISLAPLYSFLDYPIRRAKWKTLRRGGRNYVFK